MIKQTLALIFVLTIITGFSLIKPENNEAKNLEFVVNTTPVEDSDNFIDFSEEEPQKVEKVVEKPKGKWVWAIVTAYEPSRVSCGIYADGKTSTGKDIKSGDPHDAYGYAVDPKVIPYNTKIYIPIYWESLQRNSENFRPNRPLIADDTGSAMRKAGSRGEIHIDVRYLTLSAARNWGVKRMKVFIYD